MKVKIHILLTALLFLLLAIKIDSNQKTGTMVPTEVKAASQVVLKQSGIGSTAYSIFDAGFLRVRGMLTGKLPAFNRLLMMTRFAPGSLNTDLFCFTQHFFSFFILTDDTTLSGPSLYLFNRVFLI